MNRDNKGFMKPLFPKIFVCVCVRVRMHWIVMCNVYAVKYLKDTIPEK